MSPNRTSQAIIVTGGFSDNKSSATSVEASIDGGISWCSLPSLPFSRYGHTQSGLVTCGGTWVNDVDGSCLTFSDGVWRKTHSLVNKRLYHSVWSSSEGLLLMGGVGAGNSTEIIKDGYYSAESFPLKYEIVLACQIQFDEMVIVTGGQDSENAVFAYDNQGLLEEYDLPDLLEGRYNHGCGHYVNNENIIVYLVTGGYHHDYLSSTEILVSGAKSWIEKGKLPMQVNSLMGISIDNKILMTGGRGVDGLMQFMYHSMVLSYDVKSEQWIHIGNMSLERSHHGISMVPTEEVISYCGADFPK